MAKKKFTPVVAVLNMKGGVGKTTLSANLFRRMYFTHQINTLLLDLDPQFNLTQSLFTKEDYEILKTSKKTIFSIFDKKTKSGLSEISQAHETSLPVSEIRKTLRHFSKTDPRIALDVVAGDFNLVMYSLMDDSKKLNEAKIRFKSFIEQCQDEYGLVVLDCNPSSSFLTMCSLSVCTHILVPVKLDKYSVIGLEMLWEFVHNRMAIHPKPSFTILLNGVNRKSPTKSMIETETELRGHSIFGSKTLANTLCETGQLRARSDYTGFNVDRKTSVSTKIRNELDAISNELSKKLGLGQ
ncbi:MAG: hypothetical protein JWQ16_2063 [Novosphingobium sp.]|nr:hypothetical protein [Novosphingobium sp.]